MDKKSYIAPITILVSYEVKSHLMDVSMPKDSGGSNTPEVKEYQDDWDEE